MRSIPRPLTLIIMDGFGLNPDSRGNAIMAAHKPNYDYFISKYRHTTLKTSGLAVGLPEGQMGNSEVGHLNIGAGRVVYQEVTRIDKSISDGDFFENSVLVDHINAVKKKSGKIHLMGLASDGLVHASLEHMYALMEFCRRRKANDVIIHAFLDGRDTSPTSGIHYINQVQERCRKIGIGRIGTIIGRYYAMDRDKRWQRTKKAYDLVVFGKGIQTNNPVSEIQRHYSQGITDEFMEPISVQGFDHTIRANDGIVFFNFRADRARQLSYALANADFDGFSRDGAPVVPLVSMTLYDVNLKAGVAYPQHHMKDLLGEVISRHGLRQLRTAETEKYPHVTFFFNGGSEEPYPGEDRILIPSPKVATYDLKPEMSAYELTQSTLEQINKNIYDVIVMNYANCDMVGHSGIFEAARKATEVVDECVGKIVAAVRNAGGVSLITADHGNSEKMLDENGGPFTAHTTFPVPFIVIDDQFHGRIREGGILADIAPTMLDYLQIPKPPAMNWHSLLIYE